jgi:hypothetical protein
MSQQDHVNLRHVEWSKLSGGILSRASDALNVVKQLWVNYLLAMLSSVRGLKTHSLVILCLCLMTGASLLRKYSSNKGENCGG